MGNDPLWLQPTCRGGWRTPRRSSPGWKIELVLGKGQLRAQQQPRNAPVQVWEGEMGREDPKARVVGARAEGWSVQGTELGDSRALGQLQRKGTQLEQADRHRNAFPGALVRICSTPTFSS